MQDAPRQRIKELLLLHRTRERRAQGLALVPGFKCVGELLASPWPLVEVLATDEALDKLPNSLRKRLDRGVPLLRIHESDAVKLAAQPTPEGLVAVAAVPAGLEDTLALTGDGGPQLVLDGLADPGNLGSVIRTAAWFGITRVVLVGDCADLCSAKVLRASMGAVFRLTRACRVEDVGQSEWTGSGRWIGLEALGDHPLQGFRFLPGDVLVMGSESHGLGPTQTRLDTTLSIPGAAGVESLNVGHAFAITAWEQYRQALDD